MKIEINNTRSTIPFSELLPGDAYRTQVNGFTYMRTPNGSVCLDSGNLHPCLDGGSPVFKLYNVKLTADM